MENRGTVKFFDDVRGFGFVTLDGGRDIFLHSSVLTRCGVGAVTVGDRCEFDLEKDRTGRLRVSELRLL